MLNTIKFFKYLIAALVLMIALLAAQSKLENPVQNNLEIIVFKTDSLAKQKDYKAAIKVFSESLSLDGANHSKNDSIGFFNYLGYLYLGDNQLDNAYKILWKAIDLERAIKRHTSNITTR